MFCVLSRSVSLFTYTVNWQKVKTRTVSVLIQRVSAADTQYLDLAPSQQLATRNTLQQLDSPYRLVCPSACYKLFRYLYTYPALPHPNMSHLPGTIYDLCSIPLTLSHVNVWIEKSGFDSEHWWGFSLLTSKVCSACLPSSPAVRTGAVPREVNQTRREAGHATPSNAEYDECVEPYLHFPICVYSVALCLLIRRTTLPLYMPAILLLVPTNMTQCSLAEVHRRFGGSNILRNAST